MGDENGLILSKEVGAPAVHDFYNDTSLALRDSGERWAAMKVILVVDDRRRDGDGRLEISVQTTVVKSSFVEGATFDGDGLYSGVQRHGDRV